MRSWLKIHKLLPDCLPIGGAVLYKRFCIYLEELLTYMSDFPSSRLVLKAYISENVDLLCGLRIWIADVFAIFGLEFSYRKTDSSTFVSQI